jgi:hypothetical protein
MKKSIVIALLLGVVLCSTSCNKAKQLNIINTFAKMYFPQAEVLASIKDGIDYDVTLTDYTQIGFDGNIFGKLEWDEVDCRHASIYTAVPAALVPQQITDYVTRTQPTLTIVKIAKDNRGWDIELSNGIEIEFDKRFNVTDFGD